MMRKVSRTAAAVAMLLVSAPVVGTQQHDQHDSHADHAPIAADHPDIERARVAIMAAYSTPEKARAAGYRQPRSGTPTMGEHWANPALVRDSALDLENPEVLMFAEIDGRATLVGAAWIRREAANAPEPQLFEGISGIWHRHDASDPLIQAMLGGQRKDGATQLRQRERAVRRSGTNRPRRWPGAGDQNRGGFQAGEFGITMAHLWLIPASDGPFTGHNHLLPFLSAGLPVPPSGLERETLGAAALAVAEAWSSSGIVQRGYAALSEDGRAAVDGHRADIRTLAERYTQALASDDSAEITSLLVAMGAKWRAIRAVQARDLPAQFGNMLDTAYTNMIGGHGHH